MDQTRDWIEIVLAARLAFAWSAKLLERCYNTYYDRSDSGRHIRQSLICEHTNGKRAPFMKRVRTKLASLVLRDV